MPLTNSHLAYTTEFEAFDRAIADPKGIRVYKGTESAARVFRFRLHHARRLDRERTKEVYAPGDPGYGTSSYDTIVCKLKEDTKGGWWVYLERSEAVEMHMESLSEEPAP